MKITPLQLLLWALGAILIVRFGLPGMVWGPGWLPEALEGSATVDNEFRFMAALAATAGVLVLWFARAPELHAAPLTIILAGTFLGGIVRIVAAFGAGMPARPAVIAMAIELIAPPIAYLLLRSATRR